MIIPQIEKRGAVMKTKLTLLAFVPLILLSSCYYGNYEHLSFTDYYYPEPDTIVIIQSVPYPVYPNPPANPAVPTKPRPIPNNDRKNSTVTDKNSPSRPSQNNNTQRNSGERNISRNGG